MSPALAALYNIARFTAGVYSLVEGIRDGQYVTTSIGIATIVQGIYERVVGAIESIGTLDLLMNFREDPVKNDRTGDIVQISDRNKPNWRAPWD